MKLVEDVVCKMLEKFGHKGQIAVAIEELCELSSAIAKFIRYNDPLEAIQETGEKVLDEYCDGIVVMHTIALVYGFDYDTTIAGGNEKLLGNKTIAMAMKNLCRLSENVTTYLLTDKIQCDNLSEVKDSFVMASISMENIRSLYMFTDEAIEEHLKAKVARIARWANSSEESLQVTMEHRLVQDCRNCVRYGSENLCKTCLATEGTEGTKPYYKEQDKE